MASKGKTEPARLAPPPAVYEGIGRIMLDAAELGWVQLDSVSGAVLAFDNCERFGYPDVRRATRDDFAFLAGNLPGPGETLMLAMMNAPDALPADVFVHLGAGGLWLLFVARVQEHAELVQSQQRINEAVLKGHGYARLLDRFVGGELVKHRLLESPLPTSMQPSTRQLTMLFADIRGFTPYCEGRDAAQAVQLLNRYLECMVQAVTEHGGIVDKIIGDAVMALFGLTDDGEDAAARALLAAEAILTSTGELFDLTATGELGVGGVGVGVASGRVAVGVLGTSARRSFTVIGHRVNLAARLESSAEPGEILIDTATWQAAGTAALKYVRQTRTLKGMAEPVEVYSLC